MLPNNINKKEINANHHPGNYEKDNISQIWKYNVFAP